jgi:hypothetical protein
MEQCVPFILFIYIRAVNNAISSKRVNMEGRRRVLCTVALHMFLRTMWNTCRSPSNYPVMTEFNQIRGFWTDLRSRPIKSHETPANRGRADVSVERDRERDTRADGHDEANWHLSWLKLTRLKRLTLTDDYISPFYTKYRSQYSRRLRRRSTAARLLRSWVRIPPGAWMFVMCCQVEVSATSWSLVQKESYRLARRCVWSRNLVKREVHSPPWAAEPEIIILYETQ